MITLLSDCRDHSFEGLLRILLHLIRKFPLADRTYDEFAHPNLAAQGLHLYVMPQIYVRPSDALG